MIEDDLTTTPRFLLLIVFVSATVLAPAFATVYQSYPWVRFLAPAEIERELEEAQLYLALERAASEIYRSEACLDLFTSDFMAMAEEEFNSIGATDDGNERGRRLKSRVRPVRGSLYSADTRECFRQQIKSYPGLLALGIDSLQTLDDKTDKLEGGSILWVENLESYIGELATRHWDKSAVATLDHIVGNVESAKGGGSQWRALSSSDLVSAGDLLRTGSTGRARFGLHDIVLEGPGDRSGSFETSAAGSGRTWKAGTYAPGPTTWSVGAETTLAVLSLGTVGDGGAASVARLRLDRGLVRVMQDPTSEDGASTSSEFARSGAASSPSASLRPTRIRLQAGPWIVHLQAVHAAIDWHPAHNRLEIHLKRGIGEVESRGQTISLEPGSTSVFPTGVAEPSGSAPSIGVSTETSLLKEGDWVDLVARTGVGEVDNRDLAWPD